jgi:uncharacterized RDD family membrane protein YckC
MLRLAANRRKQGKNFLGILMSTNPFANNPSPVNPYAPPTMAAGYVAPAKPQRRLADLMKRFLGALVDGLVGFVFVIPGYGLMGVGGAFSENQNNPSPLILVGALLLLVGAIALLVVQIYLLATRSQTIGKYVMKTQIVDYVTGQPATFVQCFVLRMLLNGLISGIPCVGAIYALVDILFIFGDEHRCLHDKIANTIVVDIS